MRAYEIRGHVYRLKRTMSRPSSIYFAILVVTITAYHWSH